MRLDNLIKNRELLNHTITETLVTKGPVSRVVLAYYVSKKLTGKMLSYEEISKTSLEAAIQETMITGHLFEERILHTPDNQFNFFVYPLDKQHSIFRPELSYGQRSVAYFDLLAKMELVKTNPEFLLLPDTWLDKINGTPPVDDETQPTYGINSEQKKIIETIMVEVLEEYGPLKMEDLFYLVNRKRITCKQFDFIFISEYLASYISEVIENNQVFAHKAPPQDKDNDLYRSSIVRLTSQLTRPMIFQSSQDHVQGYLELLDEYENMKLRVVEP